MDLIFAPLKGLTDAHFRQFFFKHFSGFDRAMAPFLISHGDEAIKEQESERKGSIETIPQLLGNDVKKLLSLVEVLYKSDFTHFNLNLGCPAPLVIKKSKGSALLAEPERLGKLLTELSERSPLPFSVKTRLGYHNQYELLPQLEGWRGLNIEELIVHARSGAQLYRGETNWNRFLDCAGKWPEPIVYNGDICHLDQYEKLIRFMGPRIKGVMIGRGIFENPFIAEEIKNKGSLPLKEKGERFLNFHLDISSEMAQRPKSFARLKALWNRFAPFAGVEKDVLKSLQRMDDPALFSGVVEEKIREKFLLN